MPDYLREIYKSFEIDLAQFNGDDSWTLPIPARYIVEKDGVIRGADADALQSMMGRVVPDLRDVILIKDVGHWVQQEAPKETNEALISFLDNLES